MGFYSSLLMTSNTVRPEQFIATGGAICPGTSAVTTASTQCRQSRTRHRIGFAGFRTMRIVWCNYYVTTGNTETDLPAVTDFQASVTMNGITKRVTFSGSNSTTMTAGQATLYSDEMYCTDFGLQPYQTPSVNFYIFARSVVAVGDVQPAWGGTVVQPAGEPANSVLTIYSSTANNQVMNGTAVNTSGVNIGAGLHPPLAIIGRSYAANKSLLIVGDSIITGFNDNAIPQASDGSNSAGGYVARATYASSVPYCSISRFASTVAAFTNANTTKRQLMYPYASIGLCNYGTNDLTTQTAAAVLTNIRSNVFTKLKTVPSIKWVVQQLVIPRATSTDSFLTLANQTPIAGFETGGTKRDPYNAGIIANVGSNGLDAYVDFNGAVADPSALDKWLVNNVNTFYSTTDGVHPSPLSASNIAPLLSTVMNSWSVY